MCQVVVSLSGGFDVVGSHTYLEEMITATFSVSVTKSGVGSWPPSADRILRSPTRR